MSPKKSGSMLRSGVFFYLTSKNLHPSTTTCILTGFDPFGPHDFNPSALAALACAHHLNLRPHTPATFHQLPVTYATATTWAPQHLPPHPHLVVHLGLGAARTSICLESSAYPECHDTPDNLGITHASFAPASPPLQTSVDLSRLLTLLAPLTPWPVCLSDDPGRYVCNATYYTTLCATPHALFVHIPAMTAAQARALGKALAEALLALLA